MSLEISMSFSPSEGLEKPISTTQLKQSILPMVLCAPDTGVGEQGASFPCQFCGFQVRFCLPLESIEHVSYMLNRIFNGRNNGRGKPNSSVDWGDKTKCSHPQHHNEKMKKNPKEIANKVYIYVYTHTYICIYMYMYLYVCVCIYVDTHIVTATFRTVIVTVYELAYFYLLCLVN